MLNYNTVYALSTSAEEAYKAFSGEAWAKAIQVSVQGMATIFLVLALMWGILGIFKLVFAKKEPKAEKKVSTPAVENTPSVIEEESTVGDDAELVAIITAAVAAYRASESDGVEASDGFRVVSFKRASQNRSWNSRK